MLSLVILGFMLHDAIGFQTSTIALAGAAALLVFEKPEKIFRDLEWNTIFFFIGLFIIVGALEASGGIKMMADAILKATRGSQAATSMIILWGSGFISGIIDNIPYTATMTPMILEIEKAMGRRIRLSALVEPLARRVPGRQHDDNRGGRQRHSIGKLRETRA